MNNDFVYMYPTEESRKIFEEDLNQNNGNNVKDKKIVTALLGAVIGFFVLYWIPFFTKFDIAFLISAAFCMILLSFYLKQSSSSPYSTALSIEAYEDYMKLEYFKNKTKKTLQIYYEDIVDSRFSDNDYTSFQIAFTNNNRSFMKEYDRNTDKEIDSLYDNLFLFSLNPFSYEQFFFLYIAEDYFTIKKFYKTKKFFKTFGNQNEYLEKLEQNE